MNRLPPHAIAKMAALANAATECEALAYRAVDRIGGLQRHIGQITDPEKAASLQEDIDRLISVRSNHQLRLKGLAALVAALDHWAVSLPANVVLEPVKLPAVKILKGETVPEGVARTRLAIAEVEAAIRAVRVAQPPKDTLKETAARRVRTLAQRGKPKITVERGELKIDWADQSAFTQGTSTQHVVAMLCWLHESEMVAALENEIDAMPEPARSMSASEKAESIEALQDERARLELMEEAMIVEAEAQKQTIERRPNASPAIILGVTVKAKAKEKAA